MDSVVAITVVLIIGISIDVCQCSVEVAERFAGSQSKFVHITYRRFFTSIGCSVLSVEIRDIFHIVPCTDHESIYIRSTYISVVPPCFGVEFSL